MFHLTDVPLCGHPINGNRRCIVLLAVKPLSLVSVTYTLNVFSYQVFGIFLFAKGAPVYNKKCHQQIV